MRRSLTLKDVAVLVSTSEGELTLPPFSCDSDPDLKWIISLSRMSEEEFDLSLIVGVQKESLGSFRLRDVEVKVKNSRQFERMPDKPLNRKDKKYFWYFLADDSYSAKALFCRRRSTE